MFRKKEYKVTEQEKEQFDSLVSREIAIESLLEDLIRKKELLLEEKELWWRGIRERYNIKSDEIKFEEGVVKTVK